MGFLFKTKYSNCQVELQKKEYAEGGVALLLVNQETRDLAAKATVWVPGLQKGEVAIKDYAEGVGTLVCLVEQGIVAAPHRYVPSGFVEIPICKLLV